MNERIKALALQAGAVNVWEWASDDVLDTKNMDAEKFAELIVGECINQALTQVVDQTLIDDENNPLAKEFISGNNFGIIDAIDAIKLHFGVENE